MNIQTLLCTIFLASHLLFALSTEEAKTLISQAASFSSKDLTSKTQKPLSLLLLDLNPSLEKQITPEVTKDFSYFKITHIDRKEMLTVIRHEQQNSYSFIEPQHITKCEYKINANIANGNFVFEIKDLYRGQVFFTAQRNNNQWQIMSFTLPHYGLQVVRQQKKWQTVYLPARFAIIRFTSKAIYVSRWLESQKDREQKICDLDNLENSSVWLKNFAQQSISQKISQIKIILHASKEVSRDKVKSFMDLVARHSIYQLYFTHDRKTITKNYLSIDTVASVREEPIGHLEKEIPHNTESKTIDPVIEDPVVNDQEQSDFYEIPVEEANQIISDSPFHGKFSNDIIGAGGGAAGSFGSHFGSYPRKPFRLTTRSKNVDNAIHAGLTWLKNHQNQDGSWSAASFLTNCQYQECDGFGIEDMNTRVTALALLCFINDGNTHKQGKFKQQSKKALRYLKHIQDAEGCFDRKGYEYMHHHAIATLAMCRAYNSTYSPFLRKPLQKATQFIIKAQNPQSGWGYAFQSGVSNTLVTAWCVIALTEAHDAGIHVPQSFTSGVKKWLTAVTDEQFGRTGFMQKGDPGPRLQNAPNFAAVETMTAAAICMRISLGMNKNEYGNTKGTALILHCLPQWKKEQQSTIDYDYWFYGTAAMKHIGGNGWRKWQDTLRPLLLQQQCQEHCQKGSWPAIDAWSAAGGRVQATALNTLSLQMFSE